MQEYQRLIDNNRRWAAEAVANDPTYFSAMAEGQQPQFLYIGCSDSRVPAEVATGVGPGELFVHRNIANVVLPSDLSAMSVLQFAIDVLDVKHILLTGHYGCGGVKAAMGTQSYGLVDNWLSPIRNVVRWNQKELESITDDQARFDRVVELNVLEQLYHLSEAPVIQHAWARGRRPLLHGLVYDLRDGHLREIARNIGSQEDADQLGARRQWHLPAGAPSLALAPANESGALVPADGDGVDQIAAQAGERPASAPR